MHDTCTQNAHKWLYVDDNAEASVKRCTYATAFLAHADVGCATWLRELTQLRVFYDKNWLNSFNSAFNPRKRLWIMLTFDMGVASQMIFQLGSALTLFDVVMFDSGGCWPMHFAVPALVKVPSFPTLPSHSFPILLFFASNMLFLMSARLSCPCRHARTSRNQWFTV